MGPRNFLDKESWMKELSSSKTMPLVILLKCSVKDFKISSIYVKSCTSDVCYLLAPPVEK